jgi:hypothetical protein
MAFTDGADIATETAFDPTSARFAGSLRTWVSSAARTVARTFTLLTPVVNQFRTYDPVGRQPEETEVQIG